VVPKTRTEWWLHKIGTNISNDNSTENALKNAGWTIIKIWECQLKKSYLEDSLNNLKIALSN
jgi:DNA mismatch endonuclease (patch repair protein)